MTVSEAQIEAGVKIAWQDHGVVLDSTEAAAIYLAMKAAEPLQQVDAARIHFADYPRTSSRYACGRGAETHLRATDNFDDVTCRRCCKVLNLPDPALVRSPIDREQLRVGDPVRCVAENCPEQWRDDWTDWTGFVAGIQFCPRVGRLNYTVSDNWPPKGNGDLSDGFYDGMLTAIGNQSIEGERG